MQMLPGSPQFLALSLVLYLVFVNGLTLFLYAVDARRRAADEWPVPESTLLLLACFGGTPAAMMAARWLDREPRPATFSGTLNLIVATHLMAAITLDTQKGQAMVIDLGHSTARLVAQLLPAPHAGENG